MQIYRCLICGDTFVMQAKPENCPYCGSIDHYIVLTIDYPDDINDIETTTQEYADLLHAAQLEYTNATFYDELGKIDPASTLASLYRHLAKIEHEHLKVFAKLMKQPADSLDFDRGIVLPKETWDANISMSTAQEIDARDFYNLAASRSITPRVIQVFKAIAEVEQSHIEVDALARSIADTKTA